MTESTMKAVLGQPCWVELYASAPESSVQFYRELFGWSIQMLDADCALSHLISAGEQMVGSIEPLAEGPVPSEGWVVCLWTTDLDALAERVAPAGGQVIVEPVQVDESTRYALVQDPEGNLVGVLEDLNFTPAAPAAGLPVWYDVLSRDLEGSREFHQEVFGWQTHPMPDVPYLTLGQGDGAVCGIGDAVVFGGDEARTGWQVYFAVENADEAAARATRLGGTVLSAPADTPWGRMATVKDPQGAVFVLYQLS
ncbi:MAG: VOC family protein [Propionibacteriaceae bacterium]|nr:VOC family protein [Propionibacteriaceae bacterium]